MTPNGIPAPGPAPAAGPGPGLVSIHGRSAPFGEGSPSCGCPMQE
jgi:hypothetical protein